MLGVRQAELAAAMDQHERKLAYHTQQLRDLRLRKRALEDEQRLVQDSIDPEATAAARLAAAQARAAEEEAELQSRRQFAVRGNGLGAAAEAGHALAWLPSAVASTCLPAGRRMLLGRRGFVSYVLLAVHGSLHALLLSRPRLQIGFWGVFVALCAARSHFDSVAADGWLDAPGPFGW